jgi:chemotaxis signal transduction protein
MPIRSPALTLRALVREFFAFRPGGEDCAIDNILEVQEIRLFDTMTKLPGELGIFDPESAV